MEEREFLPLSKINGNFYLADTHKIVANGEGYEILGETQIELENLRGIETLLLNTRKPAGTNACAISKKDSEIYSIWFIRLNSEILSDFERERKEFWEDYYKNKKNNLFENNEFGRPCPDYDGCSLG